MVILVTDPPKIMVRPAAFILISLLSTALLITCKKQDAVPSTEVAKKEFEPCPCSTISTKDGTQEYIKADFDGVPVCFDVFPNMIDTFPNMLKWGYILRDTGRQYYDNLHMIRNASSSNWQAALFFENTHALTKAYPYELPRPNPEYCEIGELQINDRAHYVGCAWCPENKYNYFAQFWGNGVKMKVLSFNDDIFEGTFEGTVRTGSGKTVTIKNGRFRIKLTVYRADIKLN